MSTSVTWNGTSYTVPSTSEENWAGATKVDGLLIALVNHGFQKTGGTFTLSADADFGVTAGLKSVYYKSRGTVATTGVLRLANTEVIAWRNAANSANIPLTVDSSNQLTFNGTVVLSSSGVTQIAAGGTGATTAAAGFDALSGMSALGDIIYGGAAGTRTRLAGNTTTTLKYLVQTGDGAASAAPAWTQGAFSHLSGNATVAQGGTNLTSYTAGDILYATGATTLAKLGIGTANQILQTNAGATAPEWVANPAALDSSYEISNLTYVTSVAASALTVTLKDKAGNSPSAGSPLKIGFRSATATSGVYVQRTITSATAGATITVPSTATLGFTGGSAVNYAYIYVIDNAGTVELAISGTLFDEGSILSTTVLNTSSDSIATIYSTTARASVAVRLIGRVKFTLATAGTWDEAGDELSLVPFIKQPIAVRYTSTATTALNTATETLIDFDTKVIDTHNAVVTGGSWLFTSPKAGLFSVSFSLRITGTWTSGDTVETYLYKGVSNHAVLQYCQFTGSVTQNLLLQGSAIISLVAGDTLSIKVRQDGGASVALESAVAYDAINIFEILAP